MSVIGERLALALCLPPLPPSVRWGTYPGNRRKPTACEQARSTVQDSHDGGYLDGCEIGKRVRNCIWQYDQVLVAHRAAGVDDVRYVALPLGRLGPDQGLARPGKYLGGVCLIEQDRSD